MAGAITRKPHSLQWIRGRSGLFQHRRKGLFMVGVDSPFIIR